MQIETIHPRCAGIVTDIGISNKHVELRHVLSKRRRSRERKECKQTQYCLQLHTTSLRMFFAQERAPVARPCVFARPLQAGKQIAARTLSLCSLYRCG